MKTESGSPETPEPGAEGAERFQRRVVHKISPWPFVGMAGMAAVLFLYAFSGLLAPWWFVAFLLVIWAGLFVLALRWFTPHPMRVAWLPAVAALLWFVLLNLGSAVFNFTA